MCVNDASNLKNIPLITRTHHLDEVFGKKNRKKIQIPTKQRGLVNLCPH